MTGYKAHIVSIYGLDVLNKGQIQIQIQSLLDKDSFLCPATQSEVHSPTTPQLRSIRTIGYLMLTESVGCQACQHYFQASEISTLILSNYLSTPRRWGLQDDESPNWINPTFIFLITACIHCMKKLLTGEYVYQKNSSGTQQRVRLFSDIDHRISASMT